MAQEDAITFNGCALGELERCSMIAKTLATDWISFDIVIIHSATLRPHK